MTNTDFLTDKPSAYGTILSASMEANARQVTVFLSTTRGCFRMSSVDAADAVPSCAEDIATEAAFLAARFIARQALYAAEDARIAARKAKRAAARPATPTRPARSYETWRVAIDAELVRTVGLDTHALPDWDFRRAFERRMTPTAAAKALLRHAETF